MFAVVKWLLHYACVASLVTECNDDNELLS